METIKIIISLVDNLGVGIFLGAGILYLIIKFFFPSYLAEKGKNLATKEDIEAITDKVESVKTEYAKTLEEVRSGNQLRLSEIAREKNIKKEVYLEAVKAVHKIHASIANLPNLDMDYQKNYYEMVSDEGTIAKIQIVGSEETVKAVTTVTTAISTAILELILQRNALITRKDIISLYETHRTKSSEEISRCLEALKNFNMGVVQDKRLLDVLKKNIEFETKQRDGYTQKINELHEIQVKEHLEFTKMCMKHFFAISELLPAAVLSVRNELNMKISNKAYMDIYRESIETGKRIFNDFLNKLIDKNET